jgi:hypothetical protein
MSKTKNKHLEKDLCALFEKWSGESAEQIIKLAQSGSDRAYYRIRGNTQSCIGTHSPDKKENNAFISFTKHFRNKDLPVPQLYAIDEVKNSISGMLAPEIKENIVGLAEVRDVFRSPKFGAIAGCMVIDGFVKRNLPIRVLRENVVIFEGQLESLRRFKDDAAEVKMGMECGIGVKNYNDVQAGDQIEVFERTEVRRVL